MNTDLLLLESCLDQATKLVAGALKIKNMDSKQRLAIKAALRYLKLASSPEGVPKPTLVQ